MTCPECPHCRRQPRQATCEGCGTTITTTYAKPRRYCSADCANEGTRAAARERLAAMVDEIHDLRSHGFTPEEILRAVGKSPSAATRLLYRGGYPEVARMFNTAHTDSRRHPCPDCGDPSVTAWGKRCRSCANRAKRAVAA